MSSVRVSKGRSRRTTIAIAFFDLLCALWLVAGVGSRTYDGQTRPLDRSPHRTETFHKRVRQPP